ncbi:MAG: 23S rRNA (guanosine(2251)-2'-O)-methyltransferase RlmB [Cardiobacteriaceae bacterium]|nr:23S rRNA (guanosine(2251)-2'-O)-methyltransferase RlmB [Cardiobacteriaceae bacterium]
MKHYWIGGVHAVEEALSRGGVVKLWVSSNKRSKNVLAIVERAKALRIPIEEKEGYQLDMELPNVRHQGILAWCQHLGAVKSWQDAIHGIDSPLILVLDSIQDPHNLGACLRSALAAGVDAVLIPQNRAAEINATVHKVSCGASQILPIFSVTNLRRELELMKEQGIWVVGGAGETELEIYDVDLKRPLALVVGNEGEGIRQSIREACDYLAAIPMNDEMESLNVSVACGIMLFEARRQRR